MNSSEFDKITGLPIDQNYNECQLPGYLQESLDKVKNCPKEDRLTLGDWLMELNSSINVAENSNEISTSQAKYLREKYL